MGSVRNKIPRTDIELKEKPLVIFAMRKYAQKVGISYFKCPVFPGS